MTTDYNALTILISPRPTTLDKQYFDYLHQMIKSTFDESKIQLSTDMTHSKDENIYTKVFINGHFVNMYLSKICDWCNKCIQIKDLYNYNTCICKSEESTHKILYNVNEPIIFATRTEDTVRQDMCSNCSAQFNQMINSGIINSLADIGVIKVLPYDDEYMANCNNCNKIFHILEQYYYDKNNIVLYCKNCYEEIISDDIILINDDYDFGSIYDWIVIGKSVNNKLLCNLNPNSKYYKNIGLLTISNDECNYLNSFENDVIDFINNNF